MFSFIENIVIVSNCYEFTLILEKSDFNYIEAIYYENGAYYSNILQIFKGN